MDMDMVFERAHPDVVRKDMLDEDGGHLHTLGARTRAVRSLDF